MFRYLFILLALFNFAQAQINSPYDEQSPVLNELYNEIYFTIANHPNNVAAKRDLGDVWYTKKIENQWSAPQPAKGLINNAGYNAVLGFSNDGQEMFLYGHYSANGDVASSQGIAVSKRTGDTWSLPKNETIPYFLNKRDGSGGHITSDKKIFVFSAEGRAFDSYGNEDIYVCFNRDGVWTEPLNLGSSINTANQELTPFYHTETSTLYFSSNKPGGLGSADVYKLMRQDDTWQKWSQPQNLGSTINTDGRELHYRVTLDGYMYTSTRNSDGYGDIRDVKDKLGLNESVSKTMVDTPLPQPNKQLNLDTTFTISGRVTDFVSGKGVDARLSFMPSRNPIITSTQGQYTAILPIEQKYDVNISASGYLAVDEIITVPEGGGKRLEVNFKLQPIAVGVSVNLKHVLFRQSSAELLPESYVELDKVIDFMRVNPSVSIELGGHTDNTGKTKLNLKLSRSRVDRVKYYLVSKGIEGSRINGVGYGGSRPIASNKTDEGRKMNRRVEFKIIKYQASD